MRFKEAVRQTKGLESAYRDGLQALKRTHRSQVVCGDSRKLAGSVNLDDSLAESHVDDPRWDYGLAVSTEAHRDNVFWLEVHPATPGDVKTVLQELNWLLEWLHATAPLLNALPRESVWVASGSVGIPANSPQRRRIAQAGIRFAGKVLRL